MDIGICFWSIEEKQVKVRYLDSQFLGHATSGDLLENFNKSLVELDLSKIIQISMDGLSVNWCFYDEVIKNRKEMELHQLINIGSCGLHIIHGSFKTGIEVTHWNIKITAKGPFQILHDSTPTRADYIRVSRSNIFSLFFCATIWVEDKKVAERLLEIWPHISRVVAFWLKLPKLGQPKCKSFESVKEVVEDELTTVKLSFFSYLASIFQPVLEKYQTQAPMIPYMYSDVGNLIRSLMQIVVKHDIIDGSMSGQNL